MLGPRSRIVLVVTGLVAALAVPAAQSASAAPGAPVITALYTTDGSTAGGTEVFVDGDNLTDVTQVMFGSTPATSFDALVPSELSAVTPAHDVGVVQVRIVTTHGTSAPRSGTRFRFAPENDASLTRDTVIDRSAGGFHPPTSLSCGSTGFCATVIDGRVYTRGDDAWAVARTPRRTGYRSVACSATGACVAWGSGVATRESSGWSAAPALKGVRLAAAWCGDGGICRAVDTDGAVWQHAHGGWTKTRANLEKGIVALDCSSTGRCIAVDDLGGVYRHAHGTPWRKTVDALRSTVSQVTCWDGRKCAAGVRSDDHGELHGLLTLGRRHWHHAAVPRYGFA
ncbi:MAG: IPT/TIG domain-containing protein, partial [Williamsia herbipolensis]|nr:IPT/TIG domain-containing protein [Williamsia herbipolensis]